MTQRLRFSGCIPANLLPFRADLEIDEPAYRAHLRWLADTGGDRDRGQRPRRRGVVALAARSAAARSPSRSTRSRARCRSSPACTPTAPQEAIALARDARARARPGSSSFPPTIFMWGAQVKPDMVLRHFSTLADGIDLPLIVFEYPLGLGHRL